MEYNTQNYWVFGLCPSSGILETRKHNVSETGSVSVLLLCRVPYKELTSIIGQSMSVYIYIAIIILMMPVTVAERSTAYTAFARSEVGIVGSNSTQGMDV
jgi:hypothetical protein